MSGVPIGTIVGIRETTLGKPETAVFAVDPKTRNIAIPKRLQSFRYLEGGKLEPCNEPIEVELRLGGGCKF